MKNKMFNILIAGTLVVSTLIHPSSIFAVDDTSSQVSANTDLEELSGVSVEQMQEDFTSVANGAKRKARSLDNSDVAATYNVDFSKFVYLSNLDYDKTLSYLQWGAIKKDYSSSGSNIHLLINGKSKVFPKGIGVDSDAQIVYNIGDYSNTFTKLTGYLGVDYRQAGQTGPKVDGVDFSIEISNDGEVWEKICNVGMKMAKEEAYKFNLDVGNAKYIRLNALNGPNGYLSYDHAVFADIRLVTDDYDVDNETDYDGFKTLAEYDALISNRSIEDNFTNHKVDILEREFVNRIGYDNIIRAARYVEGVADALDWLKEDHEALQLFIEAGGYYSGSGYNAIVALGRLYKEYHADMNNLIYKKMLLATAAGYSKNIRTFLVNYGGNAIDSDPVLKYQYFKKLYDTNQFVRKNEFENYSMELVRTVMDSRINDVEIFWLRDYIEKKYPAATHINNWVRYNGYGYASYVNTGYTTGSKPHFYNEENKAKWDEKYGFLKYGISYGETNLFRIWMFMEAGAICWGLSGIGMVVNEVQGIPAIGTYQPGHEAYLLYSTNAQGKGIWSISDNIGGWKSSYTRWGGTTATEHRLMLGWGQMDFNTVNSGNNTSYTLLAQDALNDYDNYLNSMFYNLLANSYGKGSANHENALNASLGCYSKNLDAIYGLYKSHLSDENTTDDDWLNLARKVAKEYMYFPAPMVDLLKLIKPHIKDEVKQIEVDMLRTESLKKASKATSAESLQDSACREVANSLLGNNAVDLASFSFDGDNANTIVINDTYADSTIQVRVSLDGGSTWEKFDGTSEFTTEHRIELTNQQVEKITAEKDILVGLMGTDKNFTIDIKDGSAVSSSIYLNDNENRLMGAGNTLEYLKYGKWYPLDSTMRFTGNTTITVRNKRTGTTLAGPSKEYTFNEDTDSAKRKYVTIDRVNYVGCSSEQTNQGGSAYQAFDGKLGTMWHTLWDGSDKQRYIIAKFDEPLYLSGIGYIKNGGGNGTFIDTEVYTSLDGKNWTLSASKTGWANNGSRKTLDFNQPVYTEYVKIKAVNGVNGFAAASMIDFYEDTEMTKKEIVGLEIVKQPDQAFDEYTYYENEPIDLTGLVVNAIYDDGSKLTVNNQLLELDQKYASINHPQITISHKLFSNAKITVALNVKQTAQDDQVTGIIVENMPDKLTYLTGETLDTTGLVVVKEYASGRKTVINDYQITNEVLNQAGDMEIVITHDDFTTSYNVTVLKRPVSLAVTQKPSKVEYALGEQFNGTNLKILETYQDESTKELNLTEINKYYTINYQDFSNTAGNKTITITNKYDETIQTSFKVKVKPQFTYKELEFEAFENSTDSYVSGINSKLISNNKQITIPSIVKVGDLKFNVTQIGSDTLNSAFNNETIRSVVIPASINKICNNAFENLTDINLYFTSHDDFSNLIVEENAFISDEENPTYGRIYVNSQELANQLKQRIASGEASGLKNFTICSYDEAIALLEVTPIDRLTYQLGDELELDGLEVVALMCNGQRVKLNSSIYQMSEFDPLKAGKQEIVISVEDISASFEVEVIPTKAKITKQPVGVLYDGVEPVTLSVESEISDQGTLYYQWYSGEQNSYDLEPIENATNSTLTITPNGTKFYYVEVINNDRYNTAGTGVVTQSNIVAVSYIGDNEAAVDGLVYKKLSDAINAAASGQTVEILNDAIIDSTINISKNLNIQGNNHLLTRASGFKNEFINLTSGNLTIDDLTFDGGAIWQGSVNQYLNRGTTNAGLSANRPLIVQQSGKTILNNSVLQNNQEASGSWENAGGALQVKGGEVNFNDTSISSCESSYGGGAVTSFGKSVVKYNSGTISQNKSAKGGAFCVDNTSQLIINGGLLEYNLADTGGVLWLSHGRIELNAGEISQNHCNNDGIVYISGSGGIINLSSTTFKNNTAPKGKSIHYSNGTLKMSGTVNLTNQDIYIYGGKIIQVIDQVSLCEPINITNNTYRAGTTFVTVSSESFAENLLNGFVIKNGEKVYDIYQDGLNLKYGTIVRIAINNQLNDQKVVKNTNSKLTVDAVITNQDIVANLTYQWYASKNSDGSDALELGQNATINLGKELETGTWYVWCVVSSDVTPSEKVKTNIVNIDVRPFYPGSKLINKFKNR